MSFRVRAAGLHIKPRRRSQRRTALMQSNTEQKPRRPQRKSTASQAQLVRQGLAEWKRARSNNREPIAELYRASTHRFLSRFAPNNIHAQRIDEAAPSPLQIEELATGTNGQETINVGAAPVDHA
ncbi:hypothetical protein PENSPDRAFT_659341 [Peniophora sp. CONT]|nr:hypothetical protein PENSPDRAFT_659341 [Peniophora sp. CONT]